MRRPRIQLSCAVPVPSPSAWLMDAGRVDFRNLPAAVRVFKGGHLERTAPQLRASSNNVANGMNAGCVARSVGLSDALRCAGNGGGSGILPGICVAVDSCVNSPGWVKPRGAARPTGRIRRIGSQAGVASERLGLIWVGGFRWKIPVQPGSRRARLFALPTGPSPSLRPAHFGRSVAVDIVHWTLVILPA